jgi:hypothetical protein
MACDPENIYHFDLWSGVSRWLVIDFMRFARHAHCHAPCPTPKTVRALISD